VGIVFKARFSFKGIQSTYMGYFTTTRHVNIACKVDSSFKLAIPALVFTSTNLNFEP
jgi:hypothetical protein